MISQYELHRIFTEANIIGVSDHKDNVAIYTAGICSAFRL
jgi:hypothetical protein